MLLLLLKSGVFFKKGYFIVLQSRCKSFALAPGRGFPVSLRLIAQNSKERTILRRPLSNVQPGQKKILGNNKGAAAVEFALALIALFVFFAIFMQFVIFFIAEERLAFAGFAAARIYAVQEKASAIRTAGRIDPKAGITFRGDTVLTRRNVPVPSGIARYLTGGQGYFTIKHASRAFREPNYNDDNPDPF